MTCPTCVVPKDHGLMDSLTALLRRSVGHEEAQRMVSALCPCAEEQALVARSVTTRLLDHWWPDTTQTPWCWHHIPSIDEPMTDAEQAWIAAAMTAAWTVETHQHDADCQDGGCPWTQGERLLVHHGVPIGGL